MYTGIHAYVVSTRCLSHVQLINLLSITSSKTISDPISRLSRFHLIKLGTNILPTDQRPILSSYDSALFPTGLVIYIQLLYMNEIVIDKCFATKNGQKIDKKWLYLSKC